MITIAEFPNPDEAETYTDALKNANIKFELGETSNLGLDYITIMVSPEDEEKAIEIIDIASDVVHEEAELKCPRCKSIEITPVEQQNLFSLTDDRELGVFICESCKHKWAE